MILQINSAIENVEFSIEEVLSLKESNPENDLGYLNNLLEYALGDIEEIRDEWAEKKKEYEEFKEQNEAYELRISELENEGIAWTLPIEHQNLRTVSALETLIGNIRYVNIEELEALANKQPIAHHQLAY